MGKTAFIFPGQGAQYVGMGKDFYENIPVSKRIYDKACDVTGMDITSLCFTENENINITKYTQIAMLVTSVAMLEALRERGIRADVHAGLSLGEYGALVASEALSFEDACRVVKMRGLYMQEAVPEGGAMSAVLGMDSQAIESVLLQINGIVQIANYNCPGQIVISGEQKAVEEAGMKLKEAGAKRVVPLNVSGPFHSDMLKGAGERLAEVLSQVEFGEVKTPYVTNVTAEYIEDKNQIKELLIKQVSSSVRWQQSVENMIKNGTDTFIEIGPGRTLAGFMRKIDRSVTVCNIEKIEDLDHVK